ncbi:MAG: 5-formyltetrahydrofolate cyclo-ligase [Burkholderiales bacterium]|nr:5-formyltetrahydrofolate cyclo-ligase [Burkholderiales bacterium]MBH2016127.1 5-formyltetrahydrofolate cyclo-ligase [Burkholderiales bacterium]
MSDLNPPASPPPTGGDDRASLRKRLIQARRDWATSPACLPAQAELERRLWAVLSQLEPECLGVYWPIQGEFNPRNIACQAQAQWGARLALPSARRDPVEMHFLPWDGQEPQARDGCGLPTGEGRPVVPDVVLVPCVGFTEQAVRLGYGGGYFDRYLAAHPEVTALGVAWELGRLTVEQLAAAPHDQPLVAVVTEGDTVSV